MYSFISGIVVEKNPAYVVIDNHGVGYLINITLNTFTAIGEQTEVRLYVHLSIREDAHVLYGFYSEEEDNKSVGAGVVSAKVYVQSAKSNSKSGRTVTNFNGSSVPRQPKLKWFKNDRNILALIEMRCSDKNAVTSRSLTLSGSSSATMSKNIAVSIDKIKGIKTSASFENKAMKEHSSTLIFEVEF